MRTRLTPFKRASRQAASLGSIPPEMTALCAISAIWSMESQRSTSPFAPFTPGTSVRKTSASARQAMAQAAEFWSDSADGNVLVSDGGENDEQLNRALGGVGFVHRDFRDEMALALALENGAVNLAGFFNGGQKFACRLGEVLNGNGEALIDSGQLNGAQQFATSLDEGIDIRWDRGLT